MNHEHNLQVRMFGRCMTCAEAPEMEAARTKADPAHVIDTRHVAQEETR